MTPFSQRRRGGQDDTAADDQHERAASYTEIGRELGISKSRVEQIEKAALRKLADVMNPRDYL